MINRPLTPHLTIYSSQFTSKYSIWHRITGLVLIGILLFYINTFKLNFFLFFGLMDSLNQKNYLLIQNIVFTNITFIFGYHLLNGIKSIKWDLGYVFFIRTIFNFYILISLTLFFIITILILKISN